MTTALGTVIPTQQEMIETGIMLPDGSPGRWRRAALCAQTDPEAFFPEKGGSTREAKRICSRCEVKAECLTYALGKDERYGIWGGLSERERRRFRRQQPPDSRKLVVVAGVSIDAGRLDPTQAAKALHLRIDSGLTFGQIEHITGISERHIRRLYQEWQAGRQTNAAPVAA